MVNLISHRNEVVKIFKRNMTKSIHLILFISLSFMLIQCSIKQKVAKNETVFDEKIISNQDSFKLSFNIIPTEITYVYDSWRKLEIEIPSELKLTNIGENDIESAKIIYYGFEGVGESFIEVRDFKNNRIDVNREMDYDYFYLEEFEMVNIKPNEFKIDTIDLDAFYVFEKGIYKIRYIDPDYDLVSNWDTLKIN